MNYPGYEEAPQEVFLKDLPQDKQELPEVSGDITPPKMPSWREKYLEFVGANMPDYVDWRDYKGHNFVTDTQT